LLGGGWVQISNEDICGASTLPCPLKEGTEYTLNKDQAVTGVLPDVRFLFAYCKVKQ